MAQTIEYNIKVNDQGAVRTIQQMESELADLNAEIKDVDVNSEVFKKASKNIQVLNKELENTNLALKGITDEDKIRGFQGAIDVVGGSVAGLTGAIGLLGIENGEFEKYTAYAANAIAFSEGIRTAAQGLVDLRGYVNAAGGAMKAFNASILANPIVIVVAALAALTAAVIELQHAITPQVSRMETFKNMIMSLGSAASYAQLQALSLAKALEEIAEVDLSENLKDQIAVLGAFGKETIDLEIQVAERKVAAMKEGEEGYKEAQRELMVLRATRAKMAGDKEAQDYEEAKQKKLRELQEKWAMDEGQAKLNEESAEEYGIMAAQSFRDAFEKTIEKDPLMGMVELEFDDVELEESLYGEKGLITELRNGLQKSLDDTIGNRENFEKFTSIASQAFDTITNLSQQRYDRELLLLERQRSAVENNINLTEEQRSASLAKIEAQEIAAEKRRIKAENDQFTLKQSLLLLETVMTAKSYAMEQIQIAKLNVAKATATAQEIALAGTAATAKASMSLGAFVAALGPFGIAAFAISIGGIIASIISAKKKANAQVASLGGSVGGGGDISATIPSAPPISAPRDTGINPTEAASQQSVRAYVVAGDVTSTQEANYKLLSKRTLG